MSRRNTAKKRLPDEDPIYNSRIKMSLLILKNAKKEKGAIKK